MHYKLFLNDFGGRFDIRGSSGINVMGAIMLGKKLGKNKNIVTILCDYGTKIRK